MAVAGEGEGGLDDRSLEAIEIVIPNLSRRYSGVTGTNRMIAPRMRPHGNVAWFGSDAPQGLARIGFRDLMRMRLRPPRARPVRIWHARRNIEMLAGLVLKAFGWRLGLVFTSAAQRRHSVTTRWMIAQMDAVISTSDAAAKYLDTPSTLIHHGTDTDLYRPPADRAAAWAASGLPGRYGIGCFGRVRAQKGTDVFVAAMCRLLPKYPDFTAVVIGDITPDQTGFAQKLKADVAAAGLADRVVFLGYLPIEEVPLWYQRISIYAFTSRAEGFGLTLLEAMAAGNALVASRAGAAEIVATEGETALFVRPGNVEATAAALDALMGDMPRAEAMGKRARERVVKSFGVDAEAEAIAAVYCVVWERAGALSGTDGARP